MQAQDIANLFSALRDGELQAIERKGGDIQFRVYLPDLAGIRGEGYSHFLCLLGDVVQFSLQPFRNDSTMITDLQQMNKLQLKVERAEVGEGIGLRVLCAHKAGLSGARLHVQAGRMVVWDESFDQLGAAELAMLRGKLAGK